MIFFASRQLSWLRGHALRTSLKPSLGGSCQRSGRRGNAHCGLWRGLRFLWRQRLFNSFARLPSREGPIPCQNSGFDSFCEATRQGRPVSLPEFRIQLTLHRDPLEYCAKWVSIWFFFSCCCRCYLCLSLRSQPPYFILHPPTSTHPPAILHPLSSNPPSSNLTLHLPSSNPPLSSSNPPLPSSIHPTSILPHSILRFFTDANQVSARTAREP